jgi:pantoate--beta-alanine ligase
VKILNSREDLLTWRSSLDSKISVGFVPTMGALHQGHLKLVSESQHHCDVTLVSIFVNPTQFNDPNDFKNYPSTLDKDLKILRDQKVTAVWVPTTKDLYPKGHDIKITESEFSKRLCGASRPGHFDGVLTVVMKLFNLVKPNKAFFGEKDFQQLSLIQKMVNEFFLEVEIVPVQTVREPSGLALSSRNLRLTAPQKERAALIFKTISQATTSEEARKDLTNLDFKVDYIEDFQNRRYAAVWLGDVRLIDNVEI